MGNRENAYYLALDPGLHTGWALWDINGTFLDMGTVHTEEDLHDLLAGLSTHIAVVIYEQFRLFKSKAQAQVGSKMPAPKAIAQIETFARLWNASIVKQEANIKSIAERMTGVSTKGKAHSETHVLDAFNHGEYYLYKNKIKQIDVPL